MEVMRMLRIGKAILIWTTVVLMAVDPASAGLFCRWRCRAPRRCYVNHCYTRYTYCPPCPPVSCCTTLPATAPAAPIAPPAAPQPTRADRPEVAPLPMPEEAPAPAPSPPAPTAPRNLSPPEPAPVLPSDEPAPMPSPAAPADDAPLFPTDEPAPDTTPPSDVDDLFNNTTPAPDMPADEPKGDDSVDDLFKETGEPKAAPEEPVPGLDKGSVDDLFSDPTPGDKSTSIDPDAMREWTDNTGNYHVVARFVSANATHVRLFKENGRYTTVPFERLSQADLAVVRHLAPGQIASK
jgi:hypothetical protein